MKRNLFLTVLMLCLTIFFIGCEKQITLTDEDEAYNQWVYIVIESQILKDTTTYFQYGRIKKDVITRLNSDNVSGYFTLKDVRYFNDDDLLELYEDDFLSGDRVFKIKDIAKIQLLKKDPVFKFSVDDLAPSSLAFSKRKKEVQKEN